MKFYLAARYGRRVELRAFRDELVALGHVVTSRWIDTDADDADRADRRLNAESAWRNLFDLGAADGIVSFTELNRLPGGLAKHIPGAARGGRHVEHGFAMAQRKRIIVVGPRENLFHYFEPVAVYPDAAAALAAIGKV